MSVGVTTDQKQKTSSK